MTERRCGPKPKNRIVQIIPPAMTVLLAAFCGLALRDMGIEDLVRYLPSSRLAAAAALLLAYAAKSLSMVFPLTLLFLAAGVMFHPALAMLVNLAGLTVSVSLQYAIGRYSGEELFVQLAAKRPKIKRAIEIANHNEFFTSYLLRAVGILNLDLTSMALGAARISCRPFLFGSLLGLAPGMVLQTLMGRHLGEPLSPPFLVLFGAMLLLSLASAALYRIKDRGKSTFK